MTIDLTQAGEKLNRLNLYSGKYGITIEEADKVWKVASKRFAESAKGVVYGFINNPNPQGVFCTIELPTLELNGNVTNIITELLKW